MPTAKTEQPRTFWLSIACTLALLLWMASPLLAQTQPLEPTAQPSPLAGPNPSTVMGVLAGTTTQPVAGPRAGDLLDLFAIGNDVDLMAARVVATSDGRGLTTIQGLVGNPARWMLIGTVATRPRSIVMLDSELAVLFANGNWRLYSYASNDERSGLPLPAKSQMVLLSGTDSTPLAIGLTPPGTTLDNLLPPKSSDLQDLQAAPSTAPSTLPATSQPAAMQPAPATLTPIPTTIAASQPASATVERLWYFRIENGHWQPIAPLPAELQVNQLDHLPPMDLNVDQDVLWLAACVEPSRLRLWSLDAQNHWGHRRDIDLPEPASRFHVLSNQDSPRLWAAGATGAGAIYPITSNASPIVLTAQADLSMPGPRALTIYKTGYCLLFFQDGQLQQQLFSDKGQPTGAVEYVGVMEQSDFNKVLNWVMLGVVLSVLAIGIYTRSRRPPLVPSTYVIEGLAPFLPRLLAGLFDMIPFFVALIVDTVLFQGQNTNLVIKNPEFLEIVSIGFVSYLLLTLIMEVIFYRSLGKMICGLRVLSVDGTLPPRWSIVSRNLLRIVDFQLAMMPLATVLVTPLRQRLADMAAGTVVVTAKTPAREAEVELKDPMDQEG